MSLLMQALKKAERAKQSHAADEELAKPSEAFDQMLALAPQPPAPHEELTLELAALVPETPADEAPKLSPTGAAEAGPAPGFTETPSARPERAPDAAPRPRNVPPPPQVARPVIRRPTFGMPEPRTIRLLTLAGVVLLIAAVFGYIYWRAVYGPGSSRKLPMVPMPGQDIAAPAAGVPPTVYPPAALPPAYPQAGSPSGAPSYPQAAVPSGAPAVYPEAASPAGQAPVTVYPQAGQPAAGSPPASAPEPSAAAATASVQVTKAAPVAKGAPPIPNAEEEIRRIRQENNERAERMERMLDMGDPNRRRGPPPPPYVPPPYVPSPAATAPAAAAAAPSYPAAGQAYAGTPAASQPAAYGAPDSSGIRVARSSTPEHVNPALMNGYAAFNNGDFMSARQQYQAVLQQDANNRDALLGIAALAVHERQPDQAAAVYSRLLDINPNDSDALAGLAGLRTGDPAPTEARLRRVLAQAPESPSLLFALGNLYARQGRWQEAQQQYFKAYTNAPSNADYAFNLAVGLDRLGQGKLALGYYQRALALTPGGAVNFDRNAAAARIRELGGQ